MAGAGGEDVLPALAPPLANLPHEAGVPAANVGGDPDVAAEDDSDDSEDPEPDPDDAKSICSAIARVAKECGCLGALTDSLHAMCEVAGGVPILTAPLLCNQLVTLEGYELTALRLTAGPRRVRAVSAYVDKLFAASRPPTGQKTGLIGALLAVLEVIAPEPVPERPEGVAHAGGAVPAPTARDGSPSSGLFTKIAAFLDVRDDRKTSSKECSPEVMREMGELIAPLLGAAAKGSADLPSASQTKTMLNEISKYNRFPCDQSCQPDKIIRFGGDSSLSAPKAEKGKEQVAEETTCVRVLRLRFRTFSVGICGCLLKQPNTALDNMREAAIAALSMHEALVEAENLVSFQLVSTAINNCVKEARRAQNGDEHRRRGFTHACRVGAQAIQAADTLAGNMQAMGLSANAASSGAAPNAGAAKGAGDDNKPMTLKQMKQEVKQAIAGLKLGKRGKPGKKDQARFDDIDVPNQGTKQFERMRGGNESCPVDCPRKHGKSAWCGYNHSKK